MESVILVIHLIVALGIIAVVLIQPSESGGFVGGGNMTGMSRPRRGADALTKLTSILAGIFFITSLSLAIISKSSEPTKDILQLADEAAKEQPAVQKDNAVVKSEKEVNKKAEKPKAPISK